MSFLCKALVSATGRANSQSASASLSRRVPSLPVFGGVLLPPGGTAPSCPPPPGRFASSFGGSSISGTAAWCSTASSVLSPGGSLSLAAAQLHNPVQPALVTQGNYVVRVSGGRLFCVLLCQQLLKANRSRVM